MDEPTTKGDVALRRGAARRARTMAWWAVVVLAAVLVPQIAMLLYFWITGKTPT